MKSYFRVMLGKKSVRAKECFAGNYIGVDQDIHQDLSGDFTDSWRDFNSKFIPTFLAARPDKTKIAAGLACGMLWTVGKGMQLGDIVLCPDGTGRYHVGEINGDYVYADGQPLPHRRPVRWLATIIDKTDLSQGLRNSIGSIATLSQIRASHVEEIEKLIAGAVGPTLSTTDPTIDDPSAFAMESHLEEFLVKNWSHTELGKQFDIYEDDGDFGQQYETDTGPIDILAINKNKKELLVVELKKGRASDVVVGQTLRYMGYVQEELCEEDQKVRGVIIALEDDQRIRRALTMTPSIEFYRYQVSFKLVKAGQ